MVAGPPDTHRVRNCGVREARAAFGVTDVPLPEHMSMLAQADTKTRRKQEDSGSGGGARGGGAAGSGGGGDSMPAPLAEEARRRYLNYALSVITSRALPDVRDGLK